MEKLNEIHSTMELKAKQERGINVKYHDKLMICR